MLRTYLKIAYRNLSKDAGYTFINIAGLALGVACCLLIVLLVAHEWSFDAFHAHGDHIYRVYIEEQDLDGTFTPHLLTPPPLGPAIDSAYASVEGFSRLISGTMLARRGDQAFGEQVQMVDPDFLSMFSFPLLAGDEATALRALQDVVLTEEAARKYFGVGPGEHHRILGEHMTLTQGEDAFDFQIAGVLKSIPQASSIDFDLLISFENYALEENGRILLGGNDWGSKNTLYVRLIDGQDPATFEEALHPLTRVELADRIQSRRDAAYLAEGDDALQLRLQSLSDVHLNPEIGSAYEAAAHDPMLSYVLTGIGFMVLLIACINFMTLAVGRSSSRAREVGMRKVMGANRTQLMRQFWGEALITTFLAMVAAIILVALALPEFNALTGRSLHFSGLGSTRTLLALAGVIAVVGLLSGAYPAAVLSRFQPVDVLKGEIAARRHRLTRGLIVAQYAISVALIFCTIVMYRQLDYLLERDIGFKGDQILALQTFGLNTSQENTALASVRAGTASNPDVTHVLRTGYAFTQSYDTRSWTDASGRTLEAHMLGIDYGFLDALEMRVAEGRDFSPERPSDSTRSVLVNESFVRTYAIDEPVGYALTGFGGFFGDMDPVIVGVVEDFNFRSLHEEVAPAVLNMHPDYYMGMNHVLVKLRPFGVEGTIAQLQEIWSRAFPDRPFNYTFVDEDIEALYQQERRWSRIMTASAILAVVIACMGLFGLATLTVARRRKEIGIRKVLGASVSSVALLVTREFALLVGTAAVIAAPLAYLGMRQWLEEFAYRTSIPWWIFLAAGCTGVVIALISVSYQTIRAAQADPARSLRYE